MHVGELLYQIAERGVTLRCGRTDDRLSYSPAGALPPDLLTELKEHKPDIVQILREDEEFRRTGIIQCERQVFDLARSYFREDGKA
jgi:TubC N-terminal docking domain